MKLNIALRNINCTDNKVKDGQIEKYFPSNFKLETPKSQFYALFYISCVAETS